MGAGARCPVWRDPVTTMLQRLPSPSAGDPGADAGRAAHAAAGLEPCKQGEAHATARAELGADGRHTHPERLALNEPLNLCCGTREGFAQRSIFFRAPSSAMSLAPEQLERLRGSSLKPLRLLVRLSEAALASFAPFPSQFQIASKFHERMHCKRLPLIGPSRSGSSHTGLQQAGGAKGTAPCPAGYEALAPAPGPPTH